jgi:hypothetical protein
MDASNGTSSGGEMTHHNKNIVDLPPALVAMPPVPQIGSVCIAKNCPRASDCLRACSHWQYGMKAIAYKTNNCNEFMNKKEG